MSLHERSLHEAERRSHQAWAMSAFVGKADSAPMSAFDPKRTSGPRLARAAVAFFVEPTRAE